MAQESLCWFCLCLICGRPDVGRRVVVAPQMLRSEDHWGTGFVLIIGLTWRYICCACDLSAVRDFGCRIRKVPISCGLGLYFDGGAVWICSL